MLNCIGSESLVLLAFCNLNAFGIAEVTALQPNALVFVEDQKIGFILCGDEVANGRFIGFKGERKGTVCSYDNAVEGARLNALKGPKTHQFSRQGGKSGGEGLGNRITTKKHTDE